MYLTDEHIVWRRGTSSMHAMRSVRGGMHAMRSVSSMRSMHSVSSMRSVRGGIYACT